MKDRLPIDYRVDGQRRKWGGREAKWSHVSSILVLAWLFLPIVSTGRLLSASHMSLPLDGQKKVTGTPFKDTQRKFASCSGYIE